MVKYVSYEEFGAKGDGVTNDFSAMRAAHEYANENGYSVKAQPGKNYYIGKLGESDAIQIKTDVIWTGAVITIDDSDILPDGDEHKKSIFKISSSYAPKRLEADSEEVKAIMAAGGIKTTTEKLPYAPGYPAMIIPYDDTKKVYIRYGANQNAGESQHEVIVIDSEGNIDKDTPALLDYNNISYMIVYRIDDAPITLEGGTFVSVANRAPAAYTYYYRNILIKRSNVTVKNLLHKIVNEGPHGAPYAGFIDTRSVNALLVESCTFQGHKTYLNLSDKGGKTWMGTYEIGGDSSNGLYYKNCRQSNFFKYESDEMNVDEIWYDPETGETDVRNDGSGELAYIWGVMGTNYCKNITYDSCVLNRFDAHAGVYNATVKDTKIKHINLIGGGTALIKNTTVYYHMLAILRGDYGSTWNGDIIVDNVKLVTENPDVYLVHGTWANWDFGYQTYIPNVEINDFKLVRSSGDKAISVYASFADEDFHADRVKKNAELYPGEEDENGLVKNKNKPVIPSSIKIENTGDMHFSIAAPSSILNEKIKITK